VRVRLTRRGRKADSNRWSRLTKGRVLRRTDRDRLSLCRANGENDGGTPSSNPLSSTSESISPVDNRAAPEMSRGSLGPGHHYVDLTADRTCSRGAVRANREQWFSVAGSVTGPAYLNLPTDRTRPFSATRPSRREWLFLPRSRLSRPFAGAPYVTIPSVGLSRPARSAEFDCRPFRGV
jgi:hypothetical protein